MFNWNINEGKVNSFYASVLETAYSELINQQIPPVKALQVLVLFLAYKHYMDSDLFTEETGRKGFDELLTTEVFDDAELLLKKLEEIRINGYFFKEPFQLFPTPDIISMVSKETLKMVMLLFSRYDLNEKTISASEVIQAWFKLLDYVFEERSAGMDLRHTYSDMADLLIAFAEPKLDECVWNPYMGTGSILFSLFNDMFAYIAIKMTPLFHPESAETEYAENVFGSEGDAELLYMATLSLCIINQEGFGQYCTQAPKNGYDVIISDPPEIDPTVKKRTVIFNESTFTLESQWACHQVIADAFGKLSTTGRAYVLCPEQALFDIQTGIEINKVLVKYDLIELVIKLYDKWSLLIINKNKVKSKQGVIQYGHLKFPLQYIGFDLPKRTVFSEAVNSVKNMTTGAGSYAIVGIEEIRSRNYDLRPATYLNGSFADNYNDKTDTYSKINNLVKNGETEQIEFKGSVRLNVNKWIEGELDYKDDLAEKGVLKTIAGMLNKNGGKVIIGLLEASKYTDKPEKIANLPIIGNYLLLGIEEEEKWWKKGRDGYENALRDYIHSRISKAIPIEIGFIEYQNKNICCITIDKTDHEVWYYLDDSKYYVREGNSTREYTGRSADQYKKQHEKQST